MAAAFSKSLDIAVQLVNITAKLQLYLVLQSPSQKFSDLKRH